MSSSKGLPSNVGFLPGAYDDYQELAAQDPIAFDAVRHALKSLGKDGPPKDVRLLRSDEPGFPNGLAYWFTAGDHVVVFEPRSRLVLESPGGPQTVRSALVGGKESLYTVWFIVPKPGAEAA
ncbi:MAG: hypothetical protein HY927_13440 [Elusimicrobia bacterium]|nr:hypothetical protein [Elusimicrobiota bacterium]